jgi:glycerophosphoryl diester phosphodiesterase
MKTLPLLTALACFATSALTGAEIVAHRGASHDAPENTVLAAKLGFQQNADALELDIFLSKDGQLVISHDLSLKRTTGVDTKITDLTVAELKKLDAGKWKDPKFAGEPVATLDELLATVPAGKRVFIEIKQQGLEIVGALKTALDKTKLKRSQLVIITFNYEPAKAAKLAMPDLPVLYLVSYKPAKDTGKPPRSLAELVADCKAAKLDGLDLQSTWPMDAATAKMIKDAGLRLDVWTVDDPAVAKHWIALGAAGVTTNRPAFMREQLAR